MTTNKNAKKVARRLQKARGCSYTEALGELRGLPEGASWCEYVRRVEGLPDALRTEQFPEAPSGS